MQGLCVTCSLNIYFCTLTGLRYVNSISSCLNFATCLHSASDDYFCKMPAAVKWVLGHSQDVGDIFAPKDSVLEINLTKRR